MGRFVGFVIPGNPFARPFSQLESELDEYLYSAAPIMANRVSVHINFFTKHQSGTVSTHADLIVGSLIRRKIIPHESCVVEVQAKMLPTRGYHHERVAVAIEPHWTSEEHSEWERVVERE